MKWPTQQLKEFYHLKQQKDCNINQNVDDVLFPFLSSEYKQPKISQLKHTFQFQENQMSVLKQPQQKSQIQQQQKNVMKTSLYYYQKRNKSVTQQKKYCQEIQKAIKNNFQNIKPMCQSQQKINRSSSNQFLEQQDSQNQQNIQAQEIQSSIMHRQHQKLIEHSFLQKERVVVETAKKTSKQFQQMHFYQNNSSQEQPAIPPHPSKILDTTLKKKLKLQYGESLSSKIQKVKSFGSMFDLVSQSILKRAHLKKQMSKNKSLKKNAKLKLLQEHIRTRVNSHILGKKSIQCSTESGYDEMQNDNCNGAFRDRHLQNNLSNSSMAIQKKLSEDKAINITEGKANSEKTLDGEQSQRQSQEFCNELTYFTGEQCKQVQTLDQFNKMAKDNKQLNNREILNYQQHAHTDQFERHVPVFKLQSQDKELREWKDNKFDKDNAFNTEENNFRGAIGKVSQKQEGTTSINFKTTHKGEQSYLQVQKKSILNQTTNRIKFKIGKQQQQQQHQQQPQQNENISSDFLPPINSKSQIMFFKKQIAQDKENEGIFFVGKKQIYAKIINNYQPPIQQQMIPQQVPVVSTSCKESVSIHQEFQIVPKHQQIKLQQKQHHCISPKERKQKNNESIDEFVKNDAHKDNDVCDEDDFAKYVQLHSNNI